MCGIAGIVDSINRPKVSLIEQMLNPIQHRGPDGSGIYQADGVALGHTRLSILDLSDRGAQPMTRGTLTITYNGEIYNYVELRRELTDLGQVFASGTDTEVVLAAYAQWGAECVGRFEGMWAFSIHNLESNQLFCSRDRFGIKPFLYLAERGKFYFGSELSQFQRAGLASAPCMKSVYNFLVFGASMSRQNSYLDRVHYLAPGHNLIVDCGDGSFSLGEYYRVGNSRELLDLTDSEYADVLRAEFGRSIDRHLRSDVEVGVLLSGGIDSSLLASVASPRYLTESGKRLTAFTAVSGDPRNDESRYARVVAQSTGLEWVPVPVTKSVTAERWAETTRVIQQPMADSSHVMQLEVMRGARESGSTVLLDGQGADEAWMGYERYAVAAFSDLPLAKRATFARKSARHMDLSPGRWAAMLGYFSWPTLGAARTRMRLRQLGLQLDRDWFNESFEASMAVGNRGRAELQRAELQGSQLGGLLRYADLTSMYVSVEDRVPYLDHRLVELALSAPTDLLFRDGWTKYPLRRLLQPHVPEAITWRRRKIGFEAPRVSFNLADPEVDAALRRSKIATELGIDPTSLSRVPKVMAWRLYAIALWEEVCL